MLALEHTSMIEYTSKWLAIWTGKGHQAYSCMCPQEVPTHLYPKVQKHFQNVMLVGMANEINKNYTYKCVDRSRHNRIKGAKAKCAH